MNYKFYEKTEDDTLVILEPRVGFRRKFDFSSGWSRIRFGFHASITDDTQDNGTISPTGTTTLSAPTVDLGLYMGLKDDSNILPGVVGSRYIGAFPAASSKYSRHSVSASGNYAYNTNSSSGSSSIYAATEGVTASRISLDWVGVPHATTPIHGVGNASVNSTNYADPHVYEVEIGDDLTLRKLYWSSTPDKTPSLEKLESFMLGWTNVKEMVFPNPWPAGVRPDCIFFYWPWLDSRLRIHNVLIMNMSNG